MSTLMQDLRYAARQLRKSPGFTLTAVLTLALGIGANTAIFSLVHSILLRPLPFPHQDRLMRLSGFYPKGWVRELQHRATSFQSISGFTGNDEYNIASAGTAGATTSERVFGSRVMVNLFDMLGVQPALGRFFTPAESQSGQQYVVVLSHAYWQQHFGADPGVLGKTLSIDGNPRQVIGVMPSGINFPDADTQFWIPVAFNSADPVDAWAYIYLQTIGRLKDSVTPAAAQAEQRTLQHQLVPLFPWRMPDAWGADVTVSPLLESITGDTRPRLLLLVSAVALVLLIACANVANLMLARAASRSREMAVRSALGAASSRLLRQVLTESILLASIAGAVGLFVAFTGLHLLKLLLPPDTPRLAEISIDPVVLAFAAAISLATGVLFGIVPALKAATPNLQSALKATDKTLPGTSSRFRASYLLVIGQITLAVVVLTCAGLMLHSLDRLARVDPGFQAEKVITAQVSLDSTACKLPAACYNFYQSLVERARAIPGVQSAALIDHLPMTGYDSYFWFDAEDHPRSPSQGADGATDQRVTPGYFNLMGIRLLEGRLPLPSDEGGSNHTAVINQEFARTFWPGQSPLGKHIASVGTEKVQGNVESGQVLTVIGVVTDTHHAGLSSGIAREIYLPVGSHYSETEMHVLLRTSAPTADVVAALRAAVHQLDPSVPVTGVQSLTDVVAASASAPRSLTLLLLAFAFLAVLVGAIGVYSLIAYIVSWRTREIGIRLALGSGRREIAALVLRQSLLLTVTGCILGLGTSLLAARLLRSFLFNTTPTDPLTFTCVPLLLATLALLAAWLPARRAASIDPMTALRDE